ncbi:mite allergen Der p 3-like isoform X2 [Sitodiplosis mosellana]|uniref:mite allergen Der p 3-like isoform X2 n=1 Tax=Sitodiplosis mosellana TaxID=263140 RepID=UPI00244398A0|nr:mite allergen Der p 3-like isoform X2 [Sitodiplosis mosellana]
MDRITVFLLQLIVVAIGSVNSANVPTPQSPSPIYQASVQNSSKSHICNGIILHRNWILTAAQCVSNQNASKLKVFYGSNRLNHNGSYVDVKQINIHPGFNRTIIRSDIALLLVSDITFIANVSGAINLPEHDVPINQQLTASGWNTANQSEWIQHRNLETISPIECRKLNPLLNHIIRTWLICSVDTISNRANICDAGDLGSALKKDNTLYGIRTMNEETCSKSSLNIFTNVFPQLEWIRFIMTGWPW